MAIKVNGEMKSWNGLHLIVTSILVLSNSEFYNKDLQITGYLFFFRCFQWKMAGITRSTLIDGPSTILRASKLICVLIMNGLDSHCLTGPKKSVKLFQVENCVILLSTWLNQIALMMKYYIKPVKSILKDKLSSHKNSHNYSSFVGPWVNKSGI